jgi:uncharacterized protein with HEPN domain
VKDRLLALRHILDALDRIEDYAAPGRAAFDADRMRQDAIVRNLEIIGEAVSRVPDDVRAMAPDFAWRDPIGMRNWLIHGYDVVDPEIVWSTVVDDLPKLRAVVVRLLEPGGRPAS